MTPLSEINVKRREFLYSTGATSLAMLSNASWAASPPARPKARVIIIGGGMAGVEERNRCEFELIKR